MSHDAETYREIVTAFSEVYLHQADLDGAFDVLEGVSSYSADALRGRIRSLQLRSEEAVEYFSRARGGARNAPDTVLDLLRRIQLEVFRVSHAMTEGTATRLALSDLDRWLTTHEGFGGDGAEGARTLEVLKRESPRVRRQLNARKQMESVLCLNAGQFEEAALLCEDVIEEEGPRLSSGLGYAYLVLGAAHHNLEMSESARRHFENAALAAQNSTALLTRLRLASLLSALYGLLGDSERARHWDDALRADGPEATCRVLEARARRLMGFCQSRQHLVVI